MADLTITTQNLQLSMAEAVQLQDLEETIQAGLDTFVAVGEALATIRNEKLYRQSHKTFEDYCNERWNFSRSYASRLIGAASVVNDLLPMGNNMPMPSNERMTRPLAQLAPELRQEAWRRAVATAPDRDVTADQVQQVVDEMLGKAGRFQNDWLYPVSQADHLIYNVNIPKPQRWQPEGLWYGMAVFAGEELNKKAEFNGYGLVEPPELSIPSFDEALPNFNSRQYYPVLESAGIIYNDPNSWKLPIYYRGCRNVEGASLKRRWAALSSQWYKFQVFPPMDWQRPMWCADSKLVAGTRAYCPTCQAKKAWSYPHEYDAWLPMQDRQAWQCPDGHVIDDAAIVLYEPQKATPPADDPKEDEDKADQIGGFELYQIDDTANILHAVQDFFDLLKKQPALIEATISPEGLEYCVDDYDTELTEETLDFIRGLLPSTSDEGI